MTIFKPKTRKEVEEIIRFPHNKVYEYVKRTRKISKDKISLSIKQKATLAQVLSGVLVYEFDGDKTPVACLNLIAGTFVYKDKDNSKGDNTVTILSSTYLLNKEFKKIGVIK